MYQDRVVKVLDFSQTRKTDISHELKEKAMAKKSSLSSTSAPSQSGSSTDHPCLSIASLDETERVTALMWALGRYQTRWQFSMDRLATRLQLLTLKNIQSATLLLVHSPQLIKWSTPVSVAERKAHKKPTRSKLSSLKFLSEEIFTELKKFSTFLDRANESNVLIW
jgi:hypothetical protein